MSTEFSPPARDGFTAFFNDAAVAPRPNHPRLPSVIELIEDDQGRLLLDRRADAPVWALIGGSLENDETFVEALRREVHEETGLNIVDYDFFGTFSDPGRVIAYPDGNIWPSAGRRCQRVLQAFLPLERSVSQDFERDTMHAMVECPPCRDMPYE